MCLEKVDKEIDRKICKGYGWKVFIKGINGEVLGDWRGNIEKPRPRGKWLNEKNFTKKNAFKFIRTHGKYPRGWHIFATREMARQWKNSSGGFIEKVEYRDVLATGWQIEIEHYRIIVARYIRIGGGGKTHA